MLAGQHAVDGVEGHAQEHPDRNEREERRLGPGEEKRADPDGNDGRHQRHLIGREPHAGQPPYQWTKQALEG